MRVVDWQELSANVRDRRQQAQLALFFTGNKGNIGGNTINQREYSRRGSVRLRDTPVLKGQGARGYKWDPWLSNGLKSKLGAAFCTGCKCQI